jgi:hypothetical protein
MTEKAESVCLSLNYSEDVSGFVDLKLPRSVKNSRFLFAGRVVGGTALLFIGGMLANKIANHTYPESTSDPDFIGLCLVMGGCVGALYGAQGLSQDNETRTSYERAIADIATLPKMKEGLSLKDVTEFMDPKSKLPKKIALDDDIRSINLARYLAGSVNSRRKPDSQRLSAFLSDITNTRAELGIHMMSLEDEGVTPSQHSTAQYLQECGSFIGAFSEYLDDVIPLCDETTTWFGYLYSSAKDQLVSAR